MKTRVSVLCLRLGLPACGGDDGSSPAPDAEVGSDAGTDADPGDARDPGGLCAVDYPVEGVKVIFHDAAGAPLGVDETDAMGRASFDACVDGGMVTLVRPASEVDPTRRLFTVQGVAVGSLVRFTQGPTEPSGGDALSVTIQNGTDEVTQGAVEYVGTLGNCTSPVQALAGATGGTVQTADVASCLGADPTTLVALTIARDANDRPVGFARSSTTDLTTPSVATGGTWVAWSGATQVNLSNVPAGATGGFRTLIPKIDGVNYGLSFGSAPLGAGALALDYWPAQIVDEHRISISYVFGSEETASAAFLRTATPPSAIDLSQLLLARPTSIITDVVTPSRPLVTWQGGDDRADYTRADLAFTDDAGPGSWLVVAPGNPRELRVPVLDAAHTALGPSASSQTTLRQLLLIDRETTYAAHLDEGLSVLSSDQNFFDVREAANTTLRYAGYTAD